MKKNEAAFCAEFLAHKLGITKRSIDRKRNRDLNDKKLNNGEPLFRQNKKGEYLYRTLPQRYINDLPSVEILQIEYEQLQAQEKQAGLQAIDEKANADEIYTIIELLGEAKQNNFLPHRKFIKEEFNPPAEICTMLAQRWAVWETILNYYDSELDNWYNAYRYHFPEHFKGEHSKIAFSTYLRNCQHIGLIHTVDKRYITKVSKRTPDHVYYIVYRYYTDPQYNFAQAWAKYNDFCANEKGITPEISKSTFYNRWCELDDNIDAYRLRNGDKAAKQRMSFDSLLPAQHRNTQWQADGFDVAAYSDTGDNYKVFGVLDNYSKKYIGYSIGISENSELFFEGVEDAVRNTGYIPGELLTDKHPLTTTKLADRFKSDTEKMGMVWTISTNPQYKAKVERSSPLVQIIIAEFGKYKGPGILSKSRISPERRKELLKPSNTLTGDEIKAIMIYAIEKYNNTPQPSLNGLSPNEKYAQSEDKKAIPISADERAKLFRPLEQYTIKRNQITIKRGQSKYEFVLPAAYSHDWNNKSVVVAYEELTDSIYIFDPKSMDCICEMKRKPMIHGAKPDQTEEDKNLLLQGAGHKKGVETQARKKWQEHLEKMLKNNPDLVHEIDAFLMPKNIKEEAMKSSEVRRRMADMGINIDMLPERKTTITVERQYAKNKGKDKHETKPYKPNNINK